MGACRFKCLHLSDRHNDAAIPRRKKAFQAHIYGVQVFQTLFYYVEGGSTGTRGVIKIVNTFFFERLRWYYVTAFFFLPLLVLVMSLLSVHRGLSSFTAFKNNFGWNIFRHTTLLAYFTIVHKQHLSCTYVLMRSHIFRLEVHVFLFFGADKDTDLIRTSVTWIILPHLGYWM